MARIDDYVRDPNWYFSLGQDLTKTHFRNRHYHTTCDPSTGICSLPHYDNHDPHESLSELLKHMWESKLGKKVLVGGGLVIADQLLTGGLLRKSIIKSLLG